MIVVNVLVNGAFIDIKETELSEVYTILQDERLLDSLDHTLRNVLQVLHIISEDKELDIDKENIQITLNIRG